MANRSLHRWRQHIAISRGTAALLMYRHRYAREEGLGDVFIGKIDGRQTCVTLGLAAIFAAVLLPGMHGVAAMVVTMVAIFILGQLLKRTLGGQTGDTLGAAIELGELVFPAGTAIKRRDMQTLANLLNTIPPSILPLCRVHNGILTGYSNLLVAWKAGGAWRTTGGNAGVEWHTAVGKKRYWLCVPITASGRKGRYFPKEVTAIQAENMTRGTTGVCAGSTSGR